MLKDHRVLRKGGTGGLARTLCALLLAALVFPLTASHFQTPALSADMKGQPALDYKFNAIVRAQNQKPSLLVFYTTTCPVCEDFFKGFSAVESKLPENLNVNLIAMDESMDKVSKHAERFNFRSSVLHDPSRNLARLYGGRSTPFLVMTDANGRVQYTGGSLTGQELTEMTGRLAAHSEKGAFKALFLQKAPAASPG